ncbi:MAG TPA: RagB/SusD family nutrient uptake outer membrane protein [Prolixibacteraceae bacterium]|nr:RagB/SusD family nutrient uptake outer membrane protein [Prolixibacteraceae bacterium]HPR85686.1 RagB/SusD family nutrient uptake outer membrane protein [Prolixibacteraceae bacterium]
MKLKYAYIVALVAIVTGCTNLDEELYSGINESNYPQTAAQASVSHLSSYNALSNLFDDAGWWFLTQEVSSDEMVAPTRAADWYDGGKWLILHYHTWSNSADAVKGMWNNLWNGISESNSVLDKITKNDDATKKIKAEVEAIRSLYYFWLFDNFGDVPYLTTYFSAPEQPYLTKRASVFDSLTSTLERDYPLLNSIANPSYKSYASREMALALLAKLYLNGAIYTGQEKTAYYQKTIDYCNMLLNTSCLSLDDNVMDMFKISTSGTSPELIFIVPFNEVTKKGFRLHVRSLGYISKETFNMTDKPWNGFCTTPTFFDKYKDADVRKAGYMLYGLQYDYLGVPIIDAKTGSQVDFDPYIKIPEMTTANMQAEGIDNFHMTHDGARVQKYEIYAAAKENLTVNFPVFRLADVVFMKAEAELRLNGSVSSETMTLVNAIWKRANETAPAEGLTLNNILDERGKELFGEGHRRTDQIRFGTFDKPFWGMGQTNMTGVPEPNAVQNIFPIPLSAITSNPNLTAAPQY